MTTTTILFVLSVLLALASLIRTTTISRRVEALDVEIGRVDSDNTGTEGRVDQLAKLRAQDVNRAIDILSRLRVIEHNVDVLVKTTGGVWRTARGDLLAIRNMSDSHIANAIEHAQQTNQSSFLLRRERDRRLYGKKVKPRLIPEKTSTPTPPTPPNAKVVNFGTLLPGDIFFHSGRRYVKRAEDENADKSQPLVNAFCYTTRSDGFFVDDTRVTIPARNIESL